LVPLLSKLLLVVVVIVEVVVVVVVVQVAGMLDLPSATTMLAVDERGEMGIGGLMSRGLEGMEAEGLLRAM